MLYNLEADPGESDNVIDTHSEIAGEMSALLDSLRAQPVPQPSESESKQLRCLLLTRPRRTRRPAVD